MDILKQGKKILNRIAGKNEPDIRIGELDFPKISVEDITADNLSDIINNGTAIIGETSILHTKDMSQLYSITGVNNMIGRSLKYLCVYEGMNDLICKYDLIPFQSEDGQGNLMFILSEAWKMTPANFKKVYQDQLAGYGCLYEDTAHSIFNGISTVELSYEDIIKEMKTEEYACFDFELYKKYADKKAMENEKN